MTTINLLPAPNLLGLPDKFSVWRPGQAEAVCRTLDSDKRFVVLGMPTGFGKSLVYMTAGMLGDPTVYLTSTKGLQTQLITDFSDAGLVDIRGMNNYECLEANNGQLFKSSGSQISCDEGPCLSGWQCPHAEDGCHYFDAQRRAKSSLLSVTNYAYWLGINAEGERKPTWPLGQRGRIVLDEAHAAVDELGDFLAVEIGHWEIEGVLGRQWPGGYDSDESTLEEWRTWAGIMRKQATSLMETLSAEVKMGVARGKALSRLRELRSLERRLQTVSGMRNDWVMETARDRRGRRVVRFDPVWPAAYAEGSLFCGVPRVVLTSATIRPKTLELLGVNKEDYDFLEYPSSFSAARRPVTWVPTVRVKYDMEPGHARLWSAKIDAIIRGRLDRKGVIHTVSYARRDYLLRYSEYAKYMVVHDSGGTQSAIEKFRDMRAPAILVSPSVGTGFDFPDDECRYQIIGKVPFPSTQSKVLQARQEVDKDYFAYIAAQQLVQMCGRGVRSTNDWCETFIIDDNWGWFVNKYRTFMPRWFTMACRKSSTVPEAVQFPEK